MTLRRDEMTRRETFPRLPELKEKLEMSSYDSNLHFRTFDLGRCWMGKDLSCIASTYGKGWAW